MKLILDFRRIIFWYQKNLPKQTPEEKSVISEKVWTNVPLEAKAPPFRKISFTKHMKINRYLATFPTLFMNETLDEDFFYNDLEPKSWLRWLFTVFQYITTPNLLCPFYLDSVVSFVFILCYCICSSFYYLKPTFLSCRFVCFPVFCCNYSSFHHIVILYFLLLSLSSV